MGHRSMRGIPRKPRDRSESGSNPVGLQRLQNQLQKEWKQEESNDAGTPDPPDDGGYTA